MEKRVNKTALTQRNTTRGSYVKAGKKLSELITPGSKIINYGAGGQHTREGLYQGLGDDYQIDDMEPNPGSREIDPEFTDGSQITDNSYDAAVCLNVINVLESDIRKDAIRHLLRIVKTGGYIILGVRGYKGDIANTKSFEPADDPKAMWVKKKTRNPDTGKSEEAYSYQIGYDGNELKDYVESIAQELGYDVSIKRITGITKTAVVIQIKGSFTNSIMKGISSASNKKRSAKKRPIGKNIGGAIYVQKEYANNHPLIDGAILKKAEQIVNTDFPEFDYNIVKYMHSTKTKGAVTFIDSPDFDTSPEPVIGDTVRVSPDGTVKYQRAGKRPKIYHHKHEFVGSDYKGFDIEKSKQRSEKYNAILDKISKDKPNIRSRMGNKDVWDTEVIPYLDKD